MNPSQESCEPHGNVLPCKPCEAAYAEEPPKKLTRVMDGRGFIRAGQYVDLTAQEEHEEPEEIDIEEEEPDLEGYFKRFPGLGPANKIAICRTYASHLAAITRTIKRRGPYTKRSRPLSPVNLTEAFEDSEI